MIETRTAISVAMCTYNGERYLEAQLDSLAAQTRPPDELVVHDDGSTDATVEIVRVFAARVGFPVRVTINPVRLGSTTNFEKAIAAAGGSIIALCDQDDAWRPDKLARLAAAFETVPEAGCVFSDAHVVGEGLEPLGYRLWDSVRLDRRKQQRMAAGAGLDVLLRQNFVTGATMALRAELRELVLPIPTGWVHDGWIALLAAAIGTCLPVNEPLVRYRQHGGQQIGGSKRTLRQQIAAARTMKAAFFSQLAENYGLARDRLANSPSPRCSDATLRKVDAKVAHCLARVHIREARRSLIAIARELVSGRYHSYSLGWKSVASDLFL